MQKLKMILSGIIELFVLTSSAISPNTQFFPGINVNGPSVKIDGNLWDGDHADYF
jgi:hypothetical protein